MHLLVFIDDATSEIGELLFVQSESTFDYFEATKNYINRHGRPVAFYTTSILFSVKHRKTTRNSAVIRNSGAGLVNSISTLFTRFFPVLLTLVFWLVSLLHF